MDIGSIFNTALSGITGGITGIIGAIASSYMKYKSLKLQYEHEEKLKKLSMEEKRLETELKIKLAEAKIKGELQKGDQEIFKESYKHMTEPLFDKSYFDKLPGWLRAFVGLTDTVIDALRAAIRPVLTIWFTGIATWLSFSIYKTNPNAFLSTTVDIVSTVLFLTTTIVTWWFGYRTIYSPGSNIKVSSKK